MELFNKAATYVQDLDTKLFQKYLLFGLLSVATIVGIMVYYIHGKNEELITRITQLRTLTQKSFRIIEDNKKIVKEEQRLQEILDQNKDFTIKGFFEQFCREQGIVPEQGWDTRSEQVSEKFEEIILPATFRNLTSQNLVTILDALEKKEIVYIKELTIRNESSGKIAIDILLATKKYKALLE